MNNERKSNRFRRVMAMILLFVLLATDSTLVTAAEGIVSGGDAGVFEDISDVVGDIGNEIFMEDAETDGNEVSGGDAVSSRDAVSSGDAVSGGDALVMRQPEQFYEEPEAEDYGLLVAYDEYSRTYRVDGDSYVTVIGNDAATYIDESGNLRQVDNTLVENPVSTFSRFDSGAVFYVNNANDYTVMLPDKMFVPGGSEGLESGEDQGNLVQQGNGITIVSGDSVLVLYPAEGSFTEGVVWDNAIRYNNVFEHIDYQYTVLGNSVKEDIILLEKGEKNSFSYYLDTFGLAVQLENNTLYVYEEGQELAEAVFVLEAPEMVDAADELSFGVKLSVEEQNGLYLVTVTADEEWLSAKERVYPVRIDPTAIQVPRSAIHVACAEEGSPNMVIGDNQYPYAGYDDGITSGNYAGYGSRHLNCRSYFDIDYDFSALSQEAEIVSAMFQVTQKTNWSKGTTEFGLYGVEQAWEVNRLTWNNQRDYSHYFLDSRMAGASRGTALSFDVTQEVSSWINGVRDNNGFVLKAQLEAPNREEADKGVKMQCEVFYNNASASYAPKLVLSWTGELTDLTGMSLDDTTIEIYPVVERNGDKTTNTLGVVAHGMAKAGSTVHYSVINGSSGEVEAKTSLIYPDSSEYKDSFETALDYNRRLSNWQSQVFSELTPGQVYYITAYAEGIVNDITVPEGGVGTEIAPIEPIYGVGQTIYSDSFLIYEEEALDLIPRIATHYGVDVGTIMADMQMQDALTKEGNRIFIRNPQNTAPYESGELGDYYESVADGLLKGKAEKCVFGHDPINMNTGNYYMAHTDASIEDIGGSFDLVREYNSTSGAYAGSMGYGWNFTYDERLGQLANGSVIWLQSSGGIITFTKEGDSYAAPVGYGYELTENDGGYTITESESGKVHKFNEYGLLVSLCDIQGNETTLNYDMDFHLRKIISPSGKEYGITLDEKERIKEVSLPDGKCIVYEYDAEGNLISVTDPAGDVLRYEYDANHYMSAWYDENGNRVIYNTYDEQGRVTSQTDAEGYLVTLSFESGKTTSVDAQGNTVIYEYDEQHRSTAVRYADGSAELRTYDSTGNLASVTDRDGVVTTYTYDNRGNLLTESRENDTTRSYAYNEHNQLIKITDFDGGVTAYEYDEKNRLTSVTDAEDGKETYAYDDQNRLTQITDKNGNISTYTYEGACVVSMTDGAGNTWHYSYDAMNRVTGVTNPLGETAGKTYNEKGWVIKETDEEGNSTEYTFDHAGNVTAITDKEGQTSTFVYDKKNQMLSAKDPLGNTLTYTYDKVGNKLTETNPEEKTVTYVYDSEGRITALTDAEDHKSEYTYNGSGQVLSQTDKRGYTQYFTYDPATKAMTSYQDRAGNVTSYEVDVMGRVLSATYADGSSISYTWDKLSRMTSVTDQLGTTTYLTYDKNGNVLTICEGEGRNYTYEYNARNQLISSTNPLGQKENYTYDALGNLLTYTDGRGSVTTYAYDTLSRMTKMQDALSGVTSYAYDKEDRLIEVILPEGAKTTYTYDAIGQLIAKTDALSGKTSYTYDGVSRVLTTEDALGGETAYTYDGNGNLTSKADANGNGHVYKTDEEGNLLTQTYPNGEKEYYTYDNNGNVLTYTDRYGMETTYTYDAMNRIIEAVDTAGNKMTYTYDKAGNLLTRTDVLGRMVSYEYDVYGRPVSMTDEGGVTTAYAYDALDRLVSVTDGAGNVTSYSYDAAGNLIGCTEPGEALYTYTYDALSRLTEKVDAEGAATRYVYDKNGNVTGITDGNGVTTAYTYDALGRLTSYTDGNGGQTEYGYDALSRLLSIQTPEGLTEQYSYDKMGNVLSVTDALGQTTTYSYDNMYRLTEMISPLGAKETYTYDSHDVVTSVTDVMGATTAYEVDANGLVTSVTNPNGGVYSYTYDAVQRLVSITTPLGYETVFTYSEGNDVLSESDNLGRSTLYTYDVLHRLTSVTDAQGGVTTYTYDERGNQTGVTNALGYNYSYTYDKVNRMTTVTDPEQKVTSLIYDGVGNVLSVTLPGERTTSYTYDGNANVTAVTDPMGYVYQYTYDKDDRLTAESDPLAQTVLYSYDALNRVSIYTDKMGLSETYLYDAHSNVVSMTDTKGLVTNYTYDLKDRLTSVTDPMGSTAYYTYDVMDNLTGVTDYLGRGTTYTYDIEGNLTSVTDACGRTETMTYDVAGRLTTYTSNGGNKISYDYDKLNSLVEKSYENACGHESAEPVAYAYDTLGQRVVMHDGTGETKYTYDGMGRITGVTTYRTRREDNGDTIGYVYDEADNLSAIIYPDGTKVLYEYDLNDNLIKVTDRKCDETTYVYDALNRITEIHRPNGISTYNTYNARDQITELENRCDECEWVVSRYSYIYDEKGFIIAETAIESLADYTCPVKSYNKHGACKHPDFYPKGDKHSGRKTSLHVQDMRMGKYKQNCVGKNFYWGDHDRDGDFFYRIVETKRSFTYDDAGKLLSATENEEHCGSYTYNYEYDKMGNRTAVIKTNKDGMVVERERYIYNKSNQLVCKTYQVGRKTARVKYTYDKDGNLISEVGCDGSGKVSTFYRYTVENRLEAVYEGGQLLMAASYDGDGNRVFQLNYNPERGLAHLGDCVRDGKSGKYGKDDRCSVWFPIREEISDTEIHLISLIQCRGREENYELTEYINDVNREYAEVLVEQTISGRTDTSYVYGADRLSFDTHYGSSGYYLYDPRGSVTGITNKKGQIYQSYRYNAFGEITFGEPKYDNEYTYNGESYNPNIESQYLRARYYNVTLAAFITEDSYLGDITSPLTLNRYNYCVSSPLNYVDPSGYAPVVPNLPAGWVKTMEVCQQAAEYIVLDATHPENSEWENFVLYSEMKVAESDQKKQEYWEQSWENKNNGVGNVVMHGIAYLGVSRKLIDPLSQLRYVVQGKEEPVALARQNRVQNVKYFYQGMEMTLYDQVTTLQCPEQLVYSFVAANPTWSDFWDNIVPEPFEAIANGWNNLWFSDDSAFFQQLGSEAVCAAESAAVSAAVGSMATGCLDDVAGAGAKGAAVKYADDVVEGGAGVNKPYATSRPSYGKNQVEQVWENAKDPITGKVYDPSGVEITWDTMKPRSGQWDMGHIPGEKYSEIHQLYMDDVISKEEFFDWYRDPSNYRPELPRTNRSHKYE